MSKNATPIQNKMINQIVEKIEAMTSEGKVKNGVGVTKLAKMLESTPEAVSECCAIAVERGRLTRSKGRGGSYRLTGKPFVQAQWGEKTGHVAGTLAAIHKEKGYLTTGLTTSRGLGKSHKRAAVAETEGAMD